MVVGKTLFVGWPLGATDASSDTETLAFLLVFERDGSLSSVDCDMAFRLLDDDAVRIMKRVQKKSLRWVQCIPDRFIRTAVTKPGTLTWRRSQLQLDLTFTANPASSTWYALDRILLLRPQLILLKAWSETLSPICRSYSGEKIQGKVKVGRVSTAHCACIGEGRWWFCWFSLIVEQPRAYFRRRFVNGVKRRSILLRLS